MAAGSDRGHMRARGAHRGASRGLRHGNAGRGRGTSRGRGRGRGRPIYDSARLREKDAILEHESPPPESPDGFGEDDAASSSPSSDGEDDGPGTMQHSYSTLLRTLAMQSDDRPTKKRKLDQSAQAMPESLAAETERQPSPEVDIDREDGTEEAHNESSAEDVSDDEGASDSLDAFTTRFQNPEDKQLQEAIEAVEANKYDLKRVHSKELGYIFTSRPASAAPMKPSKATLQTGFDACNLKPKLKSAIQKQMPRLEDWEAQLVPMLFDYQDVLCCDRTTAKASALMQLACLHALNHIFKTRDRVLKNNTRLAKASHDQDLDLRDQGFTRPKVLIIVPTRQACMRVIETLVALSEPEQQENRKRLDEAYSAPSEESFAVRPADFRELFDGNDDDMFRVGVKFTRRTMKFFSPFYTSDIIIGSPLGLRTAINKEGGKKKDYDYLSSIEIVLVDHADALLMQNWDHVEYISEHLNLQPKEAHGCDFSRVRTWYLNNHAKYFRQTIVFASFNTPELNNLFHGESKNWTAKIKIKGHYPGAIQELPLRIRQTFSRIECAATSEDPERRLKYFTTAIVPALVRSAKTLSGTLIFLPTYFDFLRVRDYFSTSDSTSSVSFGCISEYTSQREVARTRSHFLTGRHSILLYTERAHHFNRFRIRGVKSIVMYGLPANDIFYREIVGGYLHRSAAEGTIEANGGTLRALFTKQDVLKLERVVGTDRVTKLLQEKGDTFDFT